MKDNEESKFIAQKMLIVDTIYILRQENYKMAMIIKRAVKDFNHEVGTPYYERLVEDADKLGLVKKGDWL